MSHVLVLNADYRPINVCTVRRAVTLLLKEKAEAVEVADGELRAEKISVEYPAVVRLVAYVRIPHDTRKRITRRAVFARDGWECLYCGSTVGLTIDHVVPRGRGGKHVWENLATSCGPCNHRKGDALLREVGMKLRSRPAAPRRDVFVFVAVKTPPEPWRPYLIKGGHS